MAARILALEDAATVGLIGAGSRAPGQILALGDVLTGMRPGRSDASQITLFESQGLTTQDLALAAELLDRAKSAGIGQPMPY